MISRRQLARLAKNDPEIIRALEAVFEAAEQTIPATVSQAQTAADAAQVDATAAQSTAGAAQTAAAAAQATADTAKAVTDQLDLSGASTGDLLRFDGVGFVPYVGATGSFMAGVNTVTVTNGIITAIS